MIGLPIRYVCAVAVGSTGLSPMGHEHTATYGTQNFNGAQRVELQGFRVINMCRHSLLFIQISLMPSPGKEWPGDVLQLYKPAYQNECDFPTEAD
jgi:hypothetical protein